MPRGCKGFSKMLKFLVQDVSGSRLSCLALYMNLSVWVAACIVRYREYREKAVL